VIIKGKTKITMVKNKQESFKKLFTHNIKIYLNNFKTINLMQSKEKYNFNYNDLNNKPHFNQLKLIKYSKK
jgi:hypothetical protein